MSMTFFCCIDVDYNLCCFTNASALKAATVHSRESCVQMERRTKSIEPLQQDAADRKLPTERLPNNKDKNINIIEGKNVSTSETRGRSTILIIILREDVQKVR